MNPRGTEKYVSKVKEVRHKADTFEGCKNRMCVTDDPEELRNVYVNLTLYAADLYLLNYERIIIAEQGDTPPEIKL